jgi:hypothetical protein
MPPTCLSLLVFVLSLAGTLDAQTPADPFQPVATMKQLMMEIVNPASNEILLIINRGTPRAARRGPHYLSQTVQAFALSSQVTALDVSRSDIAAT